MTIRLRHLLAALVLHALVLVVLAGGLQCSRVPVRPPVIHAVLLDPDRKEQAARERRAAEERRAEERRKAEARRKKLEEEAERKKAEDDKRQKELAEQKKIEEARVKKAEAEKAKAEADKKKAEDAARRKKEKEEERERQEQARRDLENRARMEEVMRQEARQREIAREEEARAASERQVKQSEWGEALTRHLRKNWNPPPSAPLDFTCTVRVSLLPDGSVTGAPKIARSCGSAALDRSVEEAVLRGSPLPLPRDMTIFDRDLVINFKPR